MENRDLAIASALIILLAIIGFMTIPGGTQDRDERIQRHLPQNAAPGETIQVHLTVTSDGPIDNLTITEQTAGWNVSRAPGAYIGPNMTRWFIPSFDGGTHNLTYTMTVPLRPRPVILFNGTYDTSSINGTINGSQEVTIQ